MSEPTIAAGTQAGDERLAALADDFLRRHRAGERPAVDEYARRHPLLAGQIRDVFPAMLAMEQPPPPAFAWLERSCGDSGSFMAAAPSGLPAGT